MTLNAHLMRSSIGSQAVNKEGGSRDALTHTTLSVRLRDQIIAPKYLVLLPLVLLEFLGPSGHLGQLN